MELDRLEAGLLAAERRLDEPLIGAVVDRRAVRQDLLAGSAEQLVDRLVERLTGDVPEAVVEHAEDTLRPGEPAAQGARDLATIERVLPLDVLACARPESREQTGVARLSRDDAVDPLVGRDDRDAVLARLRDDVLRDFLVVILDGEPGSGRAVQ